MPRAADRAYDELRDRIRDGRLGPGERLPEEQLAADLGVSRTPVRDALRRLHADGFIELSPHRGAVVAEWSEDDLDEIYSLRALLEGRAARLAAERMTTDEISAARGVADELARAARSSTPDLERITALNNEFHDLVRAGCRSPRLVAMVDGLVQLPLVQRTFRRYDRAALQRSAAHHLDLVGALEARDADGAEAVMVVHVSAARRAVR